MKKMLLLCQYFYPEYVSSATLPTQLAEDLVDRGMNIDVICGMPKEYANEKNNLKTETYNNICIKRVNYTEFNNKSKIGRIANFFSLFISMSFNILKMIKYDHIIVYSNPPILALIPAFLTLTLNKKYTYVVYDIAPDNAIKIGAIKEGSLIDKIMKKANKIIYKKAHNIIVLGNEMKNYLLDNNFTNSQEKIYVIPNWYDEKKITTNNLKNEKFIELSKRYEKIVLYSGNMGELQDMNTLKNYILMNRDSENILTIFSGHGKHQEELRNFIKINELKNVLMFDFLTGSDYAEVLKISDICIVSLKSEINGLGVPSKTYGYLASKKPIIAIMNMDSDIAREVVEYDAGIYIENGNHEKLYNYINGVEHDILLLQGENAYNLFLEKYTREINTEKYFNILENRG